MADGAHHVPNATMPEPSTSEPSPGRVSAACIEVIFAPPMLTSARPDNRMITVPYGRRGVKTRTLHVTDLADELAVRSRGFLAACVPAGVAAGLATSEPCDWRVTAVLVAHGPCRVSVVRNRRLAESVGARSALCYAVYVAEHDALVLVPKYGTGWKHGYAMTHTSARDLYALCLDIAAWNGEDGEDVEGDENDGGAVANVRVDAAWGELSVR